MSEHPNIVEEELDDIRYSSGLTMVSEEEAKEIAQKLYRYERIASVRVQTVDDVGPEQVKQYKDQGYLIIENFLTEVEIKLALQEISDIIHGKIIGPKVQKSKSNNEPHTPEEKELAVRKIYNYVDYAPGLRNISNHEDILSVVEKLLGEQPIMIGEQGLLKPPFGGGEKPWHQDMAYGGLFYKKQIVTAWIALDEAGLDNGCMHIIPRSHIAGGAPHYMVRDWQLCDHHVDVERDVAATMRPGSVLLFSGLLHHGTPANFSHKRRRALQFRYAPTSSELMSKEQFKLMFLNEMTDAEC